MKRGVAVVAALVAAVIAAPATAFASGSAVPAPTVSITTDAAGVALPASGVSGSWHVSSPGRSAELKTSGVVATGTETDVRSTWTSTWRHAHAYSPALRVALAQSFSDIAPGSSDNALGFRIEVRTPHGHWSNLGPAVVFHEKFMPATSGGGGFAITVSFTRAVVVQWRVVAWTTLDDTSMQSFDETVHAY
jgi:hypothetical protein